MGIEGIARTQDEELQRRIERQIVQRTWSRVHRLQVEVVGGRIVVHGRTSSYYVKQLALEGVLDVLGATDVTAVELHIDVGTVCAARR